MVKALEALRPRVVELVADAITRALAVQVELHHEQWARPFSVFGKALRDFGEAVADKDRPPKDEKHPHAWEMPPWRLHLDLDADDLFYDARTHIENLSRWGLIFVALGEARVAASVGDVGTVAQAFAAVADLEFAMTDDVRVTSCRKIDALFAGRCTSRTEETEQTVYLPEGPCIPNADGLCVWCRGSDFRLAETNPATDAHVG